LEHSEDAFNQYLGWFLENTRVQIFAEAYPGNILEDSLVFDEVGTLAYNILAKEGRQTSFSPLLNFVVRFGSLYVSIPITTSTPVLDLLDLHDSALTSICMQMSTGAR
jgi:hypothetical protein